MTRKGLDGSSHSQPPHSPLALWISQCHPSSEEGLKSARRFVFPLTSNSVTGAESPHEVDDTFSPDQGRESVEGIDIQQSRLFH
jgi:hypothetical protein